jgi:hypothetical protein
MEPNSWRCKWAYLFLGSINTGIFPSRLGDSWVWDSKIRSWNPRDSDRRMTALTRISSNFKRQVRPLIQRGCPHQQIRNCMIIIKTWSWAQNGCFIPRQTGRLTVGCNITLTLNNHSPPSIEKLKNESALPLLQNTSSWRIKHRDNFAFFVSSEWENIKSKYISAWCEIYVQDCPVNLHKTWQRFETLLITLINFILRTVKCCKWL